MINRGYNAEGVERVCAEVRNYNNKCEYNDVIDDLIYECEGLRLIRSIEHCRSGDICLEDGPIKLIVGNDNNKYKFKFVLEYNFDESDRDYLELKVKRYKEILDKIIVRYSVNNLEDNILTWCEMFLGL